MKTVLAALLSAALAGSAAHSEETVDLAGSGTLNVEAGTLTLKFTPSVDTAGKNPLTQCGQPWDAYLVNLNKCPKATSPAVRPATFEKDRMKRCSKVWNGYLSTHEQCLKKYPDLQPLARIHYRRNMLLCLDRADPEVSC